MHTVLYLGLILAGLLPQLTFAIPPPDVIVQFSQTLISSFGLIVASLTLAFTSLWTWARLWLNTPLGKVVTACFGFTIMTLSIFLGYAWYSNYQIASWQAATDAEIRSIWEQYIPAYSAADEAAIERTMRTPAQSVTWQEFQTHVGDQDYIVIDIRDRYPYEIGHIPGSLHLRFSELLQGAWRQLAGAEDTPIFIVCYLGTTGNLAAEFLTNKGFTNLYQPINGITYLHTTDPTLPFEGESVLPREPRALESLSPDTARSTVQDGTLLIDLRYPAESNYTIPLPISDTIFRERLSEIEIENYVASLPTDQNYLFICNSGASCYSARLLFHDFDQQHRTATGLIDTRSW